MNSSQLEQLSQLLAHHLGDDVDVPGQEESIASGSVSFTTMSDPNPDFAGFTKAPLFEVNLLLGEMDDDRKHRVERVGDLVLYSCSEGDSGGVTNVSGHAMHCAVGSDTERVFLSNAVLAVATAASEPLVSALQAAHAAGLPTDLAVEKVLAQVGPSAIAA